VAILRHDYGSRCLKTPLPDNAVDVTAQHIGTTVVVVGARPAHLTPKAKVTSARIGPGAAPPEEEDPAG
jgi:hypothetical protein